MPCWRCCHYCCLVLVLTFGFGRHSRCCHGCGGRRAPHQRGILEGRESGEPCWPHHLAYGCLPYVYAREDQSTTGEAGALLKAFLEFTLSAEGQGMLAEFSFIPVGGQVEAINVAGIERMLLGAGVTPYAFESSTMPIDGAGPCIDCFAIDT